MPLLYIRKWSYVYYVLHLLRYAILFIFAVTKHCVWLYVLLRFEILFRLMFYLKTNFSLNLYAHSFPSITSFAKHFGDKTSLVWLGNLLVKFKRFPSERHHFVFNWFKGVIFPYISNLIVAGSYYTSVFIVTNVVWIMVQRCW